MNDSAESIVLKFFELISFPEIRKCEGNTEICRYLRENNYRFTPDLVAGPPDIKNAKLEGLFFIDVINPTGDLLFDSNCYQGYKINVANEFRKIIESTKKNKGSCFIDSIPDIHQEFYLDQFNDKLDKYAHQRKFTRCNEQRVSANFGMVHHFNLGELNKNRLSDTKKLITFLDYIRFYKRLAPSDNIDLKNAENMILNEIFNENQQEPYILVVGRELEDLPCLFFMIHIAVYKKTKRRDLTLIMLNIAHLENSDGLYPVHNWFKEMLFDLRSVKCSNREYKEKKIQINISPVDLLSMF
jgi:hypothetical protein